MRTLITARLIDLWPLSEDTRLFTFVPEHGTFPDAPAGSHVDVHLPGDLIRSYSVTDWDPAGRCLSIAVKREPEGRGGSAAMHDLYPGDRVEIAVPQNNFPLRESDRPVVLLAGGIGITPLYAMAQSLRDSGRPFVLHYFVRNEAMAAFHGLLRSLDLGPHYCLHCDDTDGTPDFAALLGGYPTDTHYYVCGPEVMLSAVQRAGDELGVDCVFYERFRAATDAAERPAGAFRIALNSTGQEHDVPADRSILQVLREAGHQLDYSCSEGACGTCITDVLDGAIDHRDSILTDEEREVGDCMCICVSRARGDLLVLDL